MRPKPRVPMPPMPMAESPSCVDPAKRVAPAPLRRLTRREYNNVVAALLGDTSAPGKAFIADGEPRGFENNADAPMTALSAAQYAEAADRLARTAVTNRLNTLLPCAASA